MLCAASVSRAEDVIFRQDFRLGAADWTRNPQLEVPEVLGAVWKQSTVYGLVATGYSDATQLRYVSDELISSPEISLKDYTSAFLSFTHTYRYGSLEHISLYCYADGIWHPLSIPVYPTGTDWVFVNSGSISLSSFLGKTVRIAFRYTSTDAVAGTWEIQDMLIEGTPSVSKPVERIGVKEFSRRAEAQTDYEVTGVVQDIVNSTYGNFFFADTADASSRIYLYGVLTPEGGTRQFYTLDVGKDDTLTVRGRWLHYTNKQTGEDYDEIVNAVYVVNRKAAYDPDWSDYLQGNWSDYTGRTVSLPDTMYVCAYGQQALLVASERLRSPEEIAAGLPLDSVRYKEVLRRNRLATLTLTGIANPTAWRLGSRLLNLKAVVRDKRRLEPVGSLQVLPAERPAVPLLQGASLRVCGANIENYFYHWDGAYAGASSGQEFAWQTEKLCNALLMLDADLYALCEVDDGQEVLLTLTSAMNKACSATRYDYVNDGTTSNQTIKCAYIYRKDKLLPYGSLTHPYTAASYTWYNRELVQGFQEIASGERFVVSVNHFKAKSGTADTNTDRMYNVQWLASALADVPSLYADSDILVLGDLNSYSAEEPVRYLSAAGYVDELKRFVPDDYSYVYRGETGFLDHVLTTPSLSRQVRSVAVWHVNADEPVAHAYTYGDTTPWRYSDHDPVLVGLRLGNSPAVPTDAAQHESAHLAWSVSAGRLALHSDVPARVAVYGLDGRCVGYWHVYGTQTVALPAGIYVLAGEGKNYKCIIP